MVDARLPDGSRVNAVVPPLAVDGSALTIRKFAADPLTADDLISFGSLTPPDAATSSTPACAAGSTSSSPAAPAPGKTTTLNVLSSFIPDDERIVTIEDAAELQLKQEHVVRLESRPSNIEGKGAVDIRDLVKNSLRMRPDRIIVGEVRDASALDMLQAMNTGHDGSICTLHSNGPRDTLARMETMVLMAGMDLPIRAIREQVASAVDLIVHQTRFKDGSPPDHPHHRGRADGGRRDHPPGHLRLGRTRGFDSEGRALGRLASTGLRPKFLEKMAYANVTVDPLLFAPGDRMSAARPRRARSPPSGPRCAWPLGRDLRRSPPTAAATITHVEAAGDQLQVLVSVPADADVDLDGVTVTVDGHRATATAELAAGTTAVRRTAVLAIDTSDSMRAAASPRPSAAALEFLDRCPTTSTSASSPSPATVTEPLAPTQDRDAARGGGRRPDAEPRAPGSTTA